MGHSTVEIHKTEMLTPNQILSAVRAKQEDDSQEFGYSQSPDSWAHAREPSMRYLNRVYSHKAVQEIIETEVRDYHSFAFYYVDQKTWNEHFRSGKQTKALEKLKTKKATLSAELDTLIKETMSASGLENQRTFKTDSPAKFWSCDECKSKINMTAFYVKNRLPDRCPVCNTDGGGEVLKEWRRKLFGAGYVTKRAKLEAAITAVEKQMTDLQEEDVKSISVSELEKNKQLMKAVRTIIAADIHH